MTTIYVIVAADGRLIVAFYTFTEAQAYIDSMPATSHIIHPCRLTDRPRYS